MKTFLVLSVILFLWIPCFAQEPKIYTDQDLNEYKSGEENSTYQYNQEVLQDIKHQQMKQEDIERYKLEEKAEAERSNQLKKYLEQQAEIKRLQRDQQLEEEKKQKKREKARDAQQWNIQRQLDEILMWQQLK